MRLMPATVAMCSLRTWCMERDDVSVKGVRNKSIVQFLDLGRQRLRK